MDGLSALTSLLAILKLCADALALCRKCCQGLRHGRDEMKSLINELSPLGTILDQVDDLAKLVEDNPCSENLFRLQSLKAALDRHGVLNLCRNQLESLNAQLRSALESSNFEAARQQLTWKFKAKEIAACLQSLQRLRETLQLGLSSDNLRISVKTYEQVVKNNVLLRSAREDNVCKAVFAWLDAPNSSQDYCRALYNRLRGTGKWFVEGNKFIEWKRSPNSWLWLHGIPGCGKTVICSTIIESLTADYSARSHTSLAYFYFDFQTPVKRQADKFVAAMIQQLCNADSKAFDILLQLYERHNDGASQPTYSELFVVLREILTLNKQTYIVVDALEECEDVKKACDTIAEMHSWNLQQLHVLITSRKHRDTQDVLEAISTISISTEGDGVDEDIRTYVISCVAKGRKLSADRIGSSLAKEIVDTVTKMSQGMFLYAVCQIQQLEICPTVKQIRATLHSLPPSLDEYYERILFAIPEAQQSKVRQILMLLIVAFMPIRLKFAARFPAFDISHASYYDEEDELLDPTELLSMCSSLVVLGPSFRPEAESASTLVKNLRDLRLAHFSVQDYRVSDQILSSKVSYFHIDIGKAQEFVSEKLIANQRYWMLYETSREPICPEWSFDFYAQSFWQKHALEASRQPKSRIDKHILDYIIEFVPEARLCIAASRGLARQCKHLIKKGYNVNMDERGAVYDYEAVGKPGQCRETLNRALSETIAPGNLSWASTANTCRRSRFQSRHFAPDMRQVSFDLLPNEACFSSSKIPLEHTITGGMQDGKVQNETVELLLKSGALVSGRVLLYLIDHCKWDCLEVCLDYLPDINIESGPWGSLLNYSVLSAEVEAIERLLSRGACPHIVSRWDSSLYLARMKQKYGSMKGLLGAYQYDVYYNLTTAINDLLDESCVTDKILRLLHGYGVEDVPGEYTCCFHCWGYEAILVCTCLFEFAVPICKNCHFNVHQDSGHEPCRSNPRKIEVDDILNLL